MKRAIINPADKVDIKEEPAAKNIVITAISVGNAPLTGKEKGEEHLPSIRPFEESLLPERFFRDAAWC